MNKPDPLFSSGYNVFFKESFPNIDEDTNAKKVSFFKNCI